MYPTNYVTYAQVEAYACEHYERYGTKTGFVAIVKYLFEHHHSKSGTPALPSQILWSDVSDPAFFALLSEVPVKNVFAASAAQPENTIMAESVMPENLLRAVLRQALPPRSPHSVLLYRQKFLRHRRLDFFPATVMLQLQKSLRPGIMLPLQVTMITASSFFSSDILQFLAL